ncbi:NAD(P)/FAD-dependent oxidoreductase [Nafulsella turpanensis]|uniref:NAD(P)/FAD-dependent oxidoreductase n=1 Tax=Nafulsella turpanensis TaxID=1265690 RepID=UPI0003495C10|nr:FAD-dependent oxidoreductase [Nafulsella turpanensis]
MKQVVIIGNGIAGITAARHIRKRSNYAITVISGESDHFYSRTALMYLYMGHMAYYNIKPYEDWFWPKNRIGLVRDWVTQVDTKHKKLRLQEKGEISYDILLIASGSHPRKGGWPGEEAPNVQGLYSLQDLERMEQQTKGIERGVVIGGGLIGVEMAEMLHSRNIAVSLVVREKEYWSNVLPPEEAAIISLHLRRQGIDLQLESELEEIIQDEKGNAKAVRLKGGKQVDCQFVGITIGVVPNISFLEGSGIETNRGILVDSCFRTNQPDVYAIGDCAEYHQPPAGRKSLEQIWYTGRIHGETVASTICGTPLTYKPGPWFNSAKFFDIEYQVYGEVPNLPKEDTETLFWQHLEHEQTIRIAWNKSSGAVKGFSLLGIRYRHEVCARWIKTSATIDSILPALGEANFDPEFHRRHEQEIRDLYEKQTGRTLATPVRKKFWKIFG